MERKTDLEKVKSFAKGLLDVPVMETEYSPMIVSHPFTNCGIIVLPYDDDYYQFDITKDEQSLNRWKSFVAKQIDACDKVNHIFCMLNESYRLMFVSNVKNFLSAQDFATLLGEAWVSSEYANEDVNVSKQELISHFKDADKRAIMSDREFYTFKRLDDALVVYRGVSAEKKDSINALSWTTNFGNAKWFAERWGDGIVYAADIEKKDVLAYFDRKNENEVVVDFNKLQNVRVVNKPQFRPTLKTME